MIRGLLTLLLFSALALPAAAQTQGSGKEPIEITADKSLEWHRTELQYVADGNAMVKQGTTTIKADRITADYRSTAQSSMDIYRMTATGNVSIDDRGNVATGDRLVYDVDTGLATLTGQDLTMISPEQTVTARDMFEYTVAAGKIRAIGDAKVVRGGDTLYADTLTAFLVQDAQGQNTLDRVEGDGHVKITTATETLTGNRGLYRAADNTAIVTGAVKITRGQNVLTGERAEIDLTTSISRLFGSSIEDGQTGGRVRGVFYPEDKGPEDKNNERAAPAAAPAASLPLNPAPVPEPVITPEPVIISTSGAAEPPPFPPPSRRRLKPRRAASFPRRRRSSASGLNRTRQRARPITPCPFPIRSRKARKWKTRPFARPDPWTIWRNRSLINHGFCDFA